MPSWAVTTVTISFDPTLRLMLLLALPEVTVVPLTFTLAVPSATVGVIVTLDVAYGTACDIVVVAD